MICVGLARTQPNYAGMAPPYSPGKALPELADLLGDSGTDSPFNHVYAAVRASLHGLGLDAEHFGSADWNPLLRGSEGVGEGCRSFGPGLRCVLTTGT